MPTPPDPTESDFSPTVSANCALYFMRLGTMPDGTGVHGTVHGAGH